MSDETLTTRIAKVFEQAQKVAALHLYASGYFAVGDQVLHGKYKNKKGIVVRLFKDDRGIPCVEIEPVPKGKKQNKVLGLFNLWHAVIEKR